MISSDTIAAVSTSLGSGGIGIIRVSGNDAISICEKIYSGSKKLSDYNTHTINYGHIVYNDKVLDEVMVSVMKAPATYTKEDVVEINCHGGSFVVKKILEVLLSSGVRLAEPGEFTKRAFLNGRIDLSQAESVMDLINSTSEYARDTSIKQLSGDISKKIKFLREKLIFEIAYIESALDDPEHISLDGYDERISKVLNEINSEIVKLIKSYDEGALIKSGINTVIIGKPNAGKSSLLNALAKKQRAIVTDIPGTTRDTIEEQIILDDVVLNIIDTAGVRETDNLVEQIGVEKTFECIDDASLVIYVVDSSTMLDDNDRKIIDYIRNKKTICLLNKSDLDSVVSKNDLSSINGEVISISAKHEIGLNELAEEIKHLFFKDEFLNNDEVMITNIRHKEALEKALESLMLVRTSVDNGMTEDLYTIDMLDAYNYLGKIIGESMEDDLVDEIFSKFCMGK